MTRPRPGGRRRVDQVLSPDFLAGLEDLSLDEVRARRREADQEDADLSFLRRLLQARIDLVRAELRARADGSGAHLTHGADRPAAESDDELVARLTSALVDPDGPPRGLGRHLTATPSRVDEHRRAPERAWADVRLSDLGGTSDEELRLALARLEELETEVSEVRRDVHRVADALSAETGRRYRDGMVAAEAALGTGDVSAADGAPDSSDEGADRPDPS